MNSRHFPEIHLHQWLLKIDLGKCNVCAADNAGSRHRRRHLGSAKGQGVAGGRKSGCIRKEEFWKQIKEEEWDGSMHMELWEDTNTIDGPSAPHMTKKMT